MDNSLWKPRLPVRERIVITGALVLDTPARIGNGDDDGLGDMPLSLDVQDRSALLLGSSIAGALRNYAGERLDGYLHDSKHVVLKALFGEALKDDTGNDSALIVCDARTIKPDQQRLPNSELRDGVTIDPATRAAENKKKFDFELLATGTVFPLHIELILTETAHADVLPALAMILQALERGEIAIGARKTRGLGVCHAHGWAVRRYNLRQPKELVASLRDDDMGEQLGEDIAALLGVAVLAEDRRERFVLEATFALCDSFIIRSGIGSSEAPDAVSLHSGDRPILSGTSLAGALRARALRIANTLDDGRVVTDTEGKPMSKAQKLVDGLFGVRQTSRDDKRTLTASRLRVREEKIEQPLLRTQNRIRIDRLTGGVYPGALFDEQAVFARAQGGTQVQLHLEIQQPTPAEIGLAVLLLKDLWTSDLPLGGESSVGRGRLRGLTARLIHSDGVCELKQTVQRLEINGERGPLDGWVKALAKEMRS